MAARRNDVSDAIRLLEGRLPEMEAILEHTRQNRDGTAPATPDGRRIKECVAVMLVEEADGSETVHVVGDAGTPHLQLKGILHDAIYAFAHEGEPGYTVRAYPATTT
jgi:hypothetical protein